MVHRSNPSDLYLRWFLIVYLPLGLLAIELILLPFSILPRWTVWLLVVLGAYAIPATRLLVERKRSGLGIAFPRKIIVSLGVLCGMAAIGTLLFVLGMGRLTTSRGLAMVYVGGCLMILSVTVPAFRLLDIVLRKTGRSFRKLLPASRQAPVRPPARGRSQRAVGQAAKKARTSTSSPRRKIASSTSARNPRGRPAAIASAKRPGSGGQRRSGAGSPSRPTRLLSGARKPGRRSSVSLPHRSQRTTLQGPFMPPASPPEGRISS